VHRRRCGDDDGSTLIEQLIAIVVISGVLLGLLGTLGATAKGVTVGRQRTIAVSLAKQAIERLQGSDYKDAVVTGTGATSDPLVTGNPPKFGGEILSLGGTNPYKTMATAVGTTFTLKTFVTTVPVTSGAGYRRISVVVEWPSTLPAQPHHLQFSSFVFDLDFRSYPASSGSAEADGGLITLTGCIGGETFAEGDVRVALPGAHVDTSASTLRTAIATAAGSATTLGSALRTDLSACLPAPATEVGECALTTSDSIADNDSSTLTANSAIHLDTLVPPCTNATPGAAVTVAAPTVTLRSQAKTDTCATCDWATPADAMPWVRASTAATGGSSATFVSEALTGTLWQFANGWSTTAAIDHDSNNDSGVVSASVELDSPALTVLALPGLAGAVIVDPFAATASAAAGDSSLAPTVNAPAGTVRIWNGAGYDTYAWTPGAPFDHAATASLAIGGSTVTIDAHVHADGSSIGVVGAAPRTDAAAVDPSVLLVTVTVNIDMTGDAFTIAVDYGRLSARSTWLPKA
jgi:type II secretory pathway pseudopilin PulG